MRLLAAALFAACFVAAAPAAAQSAPDAPAPAERPTVGLVLSGGSAKGLAHIGVLKVLEAEGVPVDVVAGTSMGALIGGLYAMGYSAADLERIAHTLPLGTLFADGGTRAAQRLEERRMPDGTLIRLPIAGRRVRLPSGLVAGQEVMLALSRLTWPVHGEDDLRRLPRPFVTNAVDLTSGQLVQITDGSLAEAMRASMSLPTVFFPVERDGRALIDGGLVRNIPTVEARALGADLLLGIDVSGDVVGGQVVIPADGDGDVSFLGVLVNATSLARRASVLDLRDDLDLLIEPDLDGLGSTSFDAVAEWIARGEAAARARLPEIRALVAQAGGPVHQRPPAPRIEPVWVTRVELVGVDADRPEARLARARLGLRLPAALTPDDAEAAVARVYGTGLFDRVSYRVRPSAEGAALEVRAEPLSVPDRLAAGLRYDDFYGAALVASLRLRNRLRFGDTAALTLRLGDQAQLGASYFSRLGLTTPLTAGAEASLTSAPFDTYLDDDPEPGTEPIALRQRTAQASVLGGVALSNAAIAGVRLRTEFTRGTVARVPFSYAEEFTLPDPGTGEAFALDLEGAHLDDRAAAAGLFLDVDTRDRVVFPTRGVLLSTEAEAGYNRARSGSLAERFAAFYEAAGAPPEVAAALAAEQIPDARGPFHRLRVDAEAFLPIARRASVFGRVVALRSDGDALPASAVAYVGGSQTPVVFANTFLPLLGLRPQERSGSRAWLAVMGFQTRVGARLIARALVNAGDAWAAPDPDADSDASPSGISLARAAVGVGGELGLATPVGPVVVSAGTATDRLRPRLSFSVGYTF